MMKIIGKILEENKRGRRKGRKEKTKIMNEKGKEKIIKGRDFVSKQGGNEYGE